MQTINKLWTDKCAFATFCELALTVDDPQLYYLWSPNVTEEFFDTVFTKELALICIRDLLGDPAKGYFPWAAKLSNMCQRNPQTKFIIFVSIENVLSEFAELDNMRVVHIGGDWLNEIEKYQVLQPVKDKNFESLTHVINLNRNPRLHRVAISSYLYGKRIPAEITYLHTNTLQNAELLDIVPFDFTTISDANKKIFETGYRILQERTKDQDEYEIYDDLHGHSDTVGNFEKRLRSRYRNSLVEIVSETTFLGRSFIFNEKILQCMVACNFPIIMGSVGVVAFLRNMGFDMFDDIVDHSYDSVVDPLQRIVTAIESNQKLLTDSVYATTLWKTHNARFDNNLELLRTTFVPFHTNRTKTEFAAAIKELTQIKS